MPDANVTEPLTKEEYKALLKETLKEWMDDRAKEFGWFMAKLIAGVTFCAALYVYAKTGSIK